MDNIEDALNLLADSVDRGDNAIHFGVLQTAIFTYKKEIDFEITEHLKEAIVNLSYKPAFGAREMRRVVQDKVENPIAQALIADQIKKGDKIQLNPDTFELLINPVAS